MAKRGGWKHLSETLARIAETMRSRSAEISQRTIVGMADPEVRQRIKDGVKAASGEAAGLSSRPEGIETPTGYCFDHGRVV